MALKTFFSASLALLALGHVVSAALFDVPSTANYIRRATAKATILGNYVYVDGGEISQLDSSTGKIGTFRTTDQVNSTLSIDISKSWSSDSVLIRSMLKTGPIKANVQLWSDEKAGVFYSWGGKWIWGFNMTKTELSKFTADGKGGGQWSVEASNNPAKLGDLIPGEFSAYTTAKDTGFLIGGIASGWTELYRAHNQVLSGMLTFNMTTQIWQNGTTSFSPFDTLAGASIHFVPTYGPNGVILAFGGWSLSIVGDQNYAASTSIPYDLQNLTFFDPVTKTKYWQITTGDIPPYPRSDFCVAGFQNTDGGYDIFLFGGGNNRDKFTYNDAYILSLPGFVWTKLPDPLGGARAEHTCVPVGKRQILSIGGRDSYSSQGWTNPDSVPQGLLLFDMTAMKWKTSYDATAAAYESPAAIKSWYTAGSLNSVQWSSDDVKQLFLAASNSTSPGSNPGDTGGDGQASKGYSTPVGAIAGGVVGGVIGLTLIAVTAWVLLRRRRNQAPHVEPVGVNTVDSGPKYTYLGPQEVEPDKSYTTSNAGPYEVGDRQHYELHGGQQGPVTHPVELDGHGMTGR